MASARLMKMAANTKVKMCWRMFLNAVATARSPRLLEGDEE